MAATTKEELLAVTAKEFDKLLVLLEGMESELAVVKDAEDTSIKDVIGHRLHWLGLFFQWYEEAVAGREVFYPARGYKGNETKRYNSDVRSSQVNLGWDEAKDQLREKHDQLMRFLNEKSDDDLYARPMAPEKNPWTTGRWAEASGPSHYRSAAKYIRGRIRNA